MRFHFRSTPSVFATLFLTTLAACGADDFTVAAGDSGSRDAATNADAHANDATTGDGSHGEASTGPDTSPPMEASLPDAPSPPKDAGTDGTTDAGSKDAGDETGVKDAGTESGPKDAGKDSPMIGMKDAAGDASDSGGCPPLGSAPTDIYVNGTYTGPQNGTSMCPFTAILAAVTIADAATRPPSAIVHVTGGEPGGASLTYHESAVILLASGVTLEGPGPDQVSILVSVKSSVGSRPPCAVHVSGGATLTGFTVVDSYATAMGVTPAVMGNGIETGSDNPPPAVANVSASGSAGDGILVLGQAVLGPNLYVNNNKMYGVESPAATSGLSTSSGLIHVVGTANSFNSNGSNGIDLNGSAYLTFEGGTANGNVQGIRLGGTPPPGTVHTITSLTATGNTGPGAVVSYGAQSIVMRKSSLLGSTAGVGLLYTFATGGSLDIGSVTSPGGNTFGGSVTAMNNKVAGVRLCSAVTPPPPIVGDSWSICGSTGPTQFQVSCAPTTSLPTMYYDVLYDQTSGPETITSCTVGP